MFTDSKTDSHLSDVDSVFMSFFWFQILSNAITD